MKGVSDIERYSINSDLSLSFKAVFWERDVYKKLVSGCLWHVERDLKSEVKHHVYHSSN